MSTETVALKMGFPADIALAIEQGCIRYGLESPLEKAHFISQVAHESNSGMWMQEIASGVAYEGRKDLGNVYPGDGKKFKGHGLIQVTGRNNHARYSAWKYGDDRAVRDPTLLTRLPDAVDAAFWYWTVERPKLKQLSLADDVVGVTRAINGGTNGLADRKAKLAEAKQLFGLPA
ncbi:hypothetical protein ABVD92_20050 [Xanthomonas euvesicatoria]